MSKLELASLSTTAEHHIGTIGGGMDQAIIFLGTEGIAQFLLWLSTKYHIWAYCIR